MLRSLLCVKICTLAAAMTGQVEISNHHIVEMASLPPLANYLYRWMLHSTDVKCWANSGSSVADPQHFNADSDPVPAFHFDTDPDPDPYLPTFLSDADAGPDPDRIFQFDSNPDPDPTTNCFPDLEPPML